MKHLESCLDRLVAEGTVRNIFVRVGDLNGVRYDTGRAAERPITATTLFDMASVTKIVVTTSLALIALDRGLLSLDDTVDQFFDTDRREITVRHLMTHTMGIGHKPLNREGVTRGNVEELILSIAPDVPVGSQTLYSCPGYILLGKIVEKVFGMPLEEAFTRLVAEPLGMTRSGFCPTERENIVNHNEKAALLGIVNDYNCRHLGGVAGNAGLFSNMDDMTCYVKMLQRKGAPLISEALFERAIQNYTPDKTDSRGLGFLYVDGRYAQTGGLFPDGSFGHCGHTGQSVFVDPRSGFYVIVLSDATASVIQKYGRSVYEEVKQMRADIHAAIKEDLA